MTDTTLLDTNRGWGMEEGNKINCFNPEKFTAAMPGLTKQ